jgi:hypothetical protein
MGTSNLAAAALGHLGGLRGGPARAAALTPDQLSDQASRASLARWQKYKKSDPAETK